MTKAKNFRQNDENKFLKKTWIIPQTRRSYNFTH